MQKSKWLLGLALSVSVVAFAACGSPDDKPAEEQSSAAAEQGQSGQSDGQGQGEGQEGKPNTDDIPDVVAEVNGDKITKDDFVPLYETQYQQMQMQSQQSGQQVDEKQLKNQTAENLVSTKLLSQQADERGITVSDKDIDKALNESAKSSQMSKKDFLAAMKDQGMDEKKVHSELKTQLSIEDLIKDEYGDFKVSDEEIGQAYEQAKSQQEQMGQQGAQQGGQAAEVPPLEEMRPQLEKQVKSQKSTEATQKYAGKLRDKADVTINL